MGSERSQTFSEDHILVIPFTGTVQERQIPGDRAAWQLSGAGTGKTQSVQTETSVWSNESVLKVGGQLCKYKAIKLHTVHRELCELHLIKLSGVWLNTPEILTLGELTQKGLKFKAT